MFEDFATQRIRISGAEIHLRMAGSGPPLLLLHGYPQTHAIWHKVAPALATDFAVVCADLRGYGDSAKPEGGAAVYSKRVMAQDLVEVMAALGHDRFLVAGHDRGGRVTHRMCLDHAERVLRAAVLDIVPTSTLFRATNQALAMGYYHWFFLSQPSPLPERLIGADPLFYLHTKLGQWSAHKDLSWLSPEALAEYERCFTAETIRASCDDYRAAATIDLDDDATDADQRIACPLLALWGERALMHRSFDVLATWREKASGAVEGRALPCGHYLPEESPDQVVAEFRRFFG
jgi:haloacetate dehalogenase